ncbi:ATP-dependent DNA helicase [Apilactobacillus apinorum]|uniref:ATP-dependent DNA helicase n=1 Tax=Apilactobacillus apinorum TaxID=1218495 RepID=UPI0030E9AA17
MITNSITSGGDHINHIGIRDLVEFTLRSGDLNAKLNSNNTAKQGAKIHRKLQNSKYKAFENEYYLDNTLKINDIDFKIEGRADGVLVQGKDAEIIEIKTSDVQYDQLSESMTTLYWAQAKVYAHFLMLKEPILRSVKLTLCYVQTPDEDITTESITISKDDAKTFFNELISEYEEWLKLRTDIIKQRNQTANQMPFPFEQFRDGQRQFSAVVYKTIVNHKHLFAQAPTGTGKTISTLFPAIKSMGENIANRIFYLTAKQSTRVVASEAVDLMMAKGLFIKTITLTAKDAITFDAERNLKPEDNPYMIGYYDRLKPAIKDILTNHNQITRAVIEEYAEKYQIDPFEFSLDVSQFCDIIICDYNYLFDPQVHLQRFFTAEDPDNIFLIDEAHNLVSRSRDMYSAAVSNEKLDELIEETDDNEEIERLHKAFKNFKQSFTLNAKILTDSAEEYVHLDNPLSAFGKQVNKLCDVINDWLGRNDRDEDLSDLVVDFYFSLLSYQRIAELYDDTFKTRLFYDRNHNVIIKLFCMDPSPFIGESLQLGGSAILFSATLSPMDYYQRVLGDEEDSITYEIPSPFNPSNQQVIVTNYIETTYAKRPASIQPIINTIDAMIESKPGHYLIFFPSNRYLSDVVEEFQKQHPLVETAIQTADMTPEERRDYIEKFKDNPDKTLVGFALLGGIFCEGIDLKYDQLIGVGIVSVGLPGLNPENNLIRYFFDAENGHGFDFAYQLPGLNNVFQAAGRLIRTNHDSGNVILMDQRFSQNRYQKLFPANWHAGNLIKSFNQSQTKHALANFWKMHK